MSLTYDAVRNYMQLLIAQNKYKGTNDEMTEDLDFEELTCEEIAALLATNNPIATAHETACALAEFILSAEDLVTNVKHHENRLYTRRIRLTKQADSMRAYLINAMQAVGLNSLSTPMLQISFIGSSAVTISDAAALPPEYRRPDKLVQGEPDKLRIAEDLRLGVLIPGASLEKRINLRVK